MTWLTPKEAAAQMTSRDLDQLAEAERETRDAHISACGRYRWSLTRRWGHGENLVWCMINPSTADADSDDATIRKVRSFTKREGYSGFRVVNFSAIRSTHPSEWRRLFFLHEGVDEENLCAIEGIALGAHVVAAWGNHVVPGEQLTRLLEILRHRSRMVSTLGFTKLGNPRHPLYLRGDTPLVHWEIK